MRTSARFPYRVNFAGGFTDLEAYYKRYGGAIVETSIDFYARATLKSRNDDAIVIKQKKLNILERGTIRNLDGISRFYKAIIHHFKIRKGFELDIDNDVMYGSGLGSSSASICSIITVLGRHTGKRMSKREIAELAYSIENKDLGVHAGKQDAYAAVFGGLNCIEFRKGGGIRVSRLEVPARVMKGLQKGIFIVSTGMIRKSHSQIGDIIKKIRSSDRNTLEHLHSIKECAVLMRTCLEEGRLSEIGEIMTDDWEHKKELAEGVTNSEIDRIFDIAIANGAEGGKLLGGGNGGHFLFITDPRERQRIINAISKKGFRVYKPRLVNG